MALERPTDKPSSFPFHDSPWVEKFDLRDDPGRYAVTRNETDGYKYRVPTLRNIALIAPYFHNGKVRTLADAVRVMSPSQLNKELTESQIQDIVGVKGAGGLSPMDASARTGEAEATYPPSRFKNITSDIYG